MPAVLLDACVPQWLRRELGTTDVTTAHYAGLDQLSDSALLTAIEGRYDILVTLDRNLTYQQKVRGGLSPLSSCAYPIRLRKRSALWCRHWQRPWKT